MTVDVAVVDYDVGNLFSVSRAIQSQGGNPVFVRTGAEIAPARRLVLPGVGAFGNAMAALETRGLVEPILKYAESGRPLLGICLGMQLMMERSCEFGDHRGLGLFPGTVVRVPDTGLDGRPHPIPHIGWNRLHPSQGGRSWDETILAQVPQQDAVYFVHSFMTEPADERHRLADCFYDGQRLTAAIARDAIIGVQFHPEKSAAIGLRMIAKFMDFG